METKNELHKSCMSTHSGLLAGVLDWGSDMLTPLGAFGVGTGVAGLALGVATPPVLGVFECVGIGFRQSRVWQIIFWCSPIACRADGGDWFQRAFALLVWVVWMFRGLPGLHGGDLGCLLSSLCLVLCGRLLPIMLVGTDG